MRRLVTGHAPMQPNGHPANWVGKQRAAHGAVPRAVSGRPPLTARGTAPCAARFGAFTTPPNRGARPPRTFFPAFPPPAPPLVYSLVPNGGAAATFLTEGST